MDGFLRVEIMGVDEQWDVLKDHFRLRYPALLWAVYQAQGALLALQEIVDGKRPYKKEMIEALVNKLDESSDVIEKAFGVRVCH